MMAETKGTLVGLGENPVGNRAGRGEQGAALNPSPVTTSLPG